MTRLTPEKVDPIEAQEERQPGDKLMPSERRKLGSRIKQVLEQERDAETASYRNRIECQVQKWRLIHRYVHAHPFPTRTDIPRSEQWRSVVSFVRDIGDIEILDWVLLQIEVAANIERGVREMRPRKSGPCHEQLLAYCADRKRKALAVYKWDVATDGGANTAISRTLTENILKMHEPVKSGGTENL